MSTKRTPNPFRPYVTVCGKKQRMSKETAESLRRITTLMLAMPIAELITEGLFKPPTNPPKKKPAKKVPREK